jgi:hypothetical protein
MDIKGKRAIKNGESFDDVPQVPSSMKKWKFFVFGLCLVIAVFLFYFFKYRNVKDASSDDIIQSLLAEETKQEERAESRGTDKFQAVFVDNGQVYFGKITTRRTPFYRLENVFYFKQAPVTPDKKDQGPMLVKLGVETHGPEDFMEIHQDHILFIENLRADSEVTKAIEKYLEEKK